MNNAWARDLALLIITICSFCALVFLYEISLLLRKLIQLVAGITEIREALEEWRTTESEKRIAVRKDEYRGL